MHLPWPLLLRHTVLILFFLHISVARPSYYITTPNNIIPGVNTTLAVHWFGDNHSEIIVMAEIYEQSKRLVNTSNVFRNDSIGMLTLPALPMNSTSNIYELVVNASAQNVVLFSKKVWLIMQIKNISVFIQTDKAVYKPGQAVKIRVICVNHDLKPHKGLVDLYIQDPQKNIIQQWLRLQTDLGVVSAEFLLSDISMYGFWTIQAETDNSSSATSFSVNEYVVPRFEVTVNAPSFYIKTKHLNLTGTVTAKYTYGKPVKGNLTISLRPFYSSRYDINKTYEISGSVNFSFTYAEILELLKSQIEDLQEGSPTYGLPINITVSVTEELTGIIINASIGTTMAPSEYGLILLNRQQTFLPGINFTAKIQILRYDNETLIDGGKNRNISVKITQSTQQFWWRSENIEMEIRANLTSSTYSPDNIDLRKYTIQESGIVSIEFPVLQSTQRIQIEAQYQNTSETWFFSRHYETDTYVQIRTPSSLIKVGTAFEVQVDTYPKVQELYYVVMSKGVIVAAGKKSSTSFTLTPEASWAPSASFIVYFLNINDNNVVLTSRILPIKGMFRNKVSLSWSKNKAQPAENVTLTVSVGESRCLVGLRVIEKSAKLLGDGNDITASRVENEFTTFSQDRGYTPLTDAMVFSGNNGVMEFMPEITTTAVQPSEHVKTFFAETWMWLETNISSSINTTYLQVTVPDTITSWVASAFVISEGLGLGVTNEPVELEAFKSFFISLNLPYSVTRGEQFILEVILFNYLTENLEVLVTLEPSDSFEIIVVANNSVNTVAGQQKVSVPSQDGKTVLFPIKPKQLGEIPITVKATSPAASDAISQKILVKAEGVKHFYSQTVLLEATGTGSAPQTVSKSLSFTFPGDVVNGSEQAFVTVIGDLLGPSIDGLASLIQMPHGCGEQNMINFAPNIYVLQYLIETKQINGEIRTKATGYMEQGYQRELTYKRNDGSFSAFGNGDPSGSTWLSAFVLRCFLQARPFIFISPIVLQETIDWLVQHQDTNTGVFYEPGRVFNSNLQGGLNGPITLTAYILTSILEDEQYRTIYASRVVKAVQYLEGRFDEGISSNYTLSVVVYALSLANSTKANSGLAQLNSRADSIGGAKYWSSPSVMPYYWQPQSRDIETASYALLSHYKQNMIPQGIPIMKWLSQQRNHLGGYSSTQDTIMALQALSQFAAVASTADTALTVKVTGPGSFVPKTFQINPENLLVLQSQQIKVSQPLSINVSAVGRGLAIFQLNIMYNEQPSSRRKRNVLIPEEFQLDVTVKENNIERLSVNVCTSHPGGQSGMVLLDVGLLSGFTLHPEGIPISGLLKMVEQKDDKVYLYFDSMNATEVCVTIPMVRNAKVAGSQDAVITISDYYNPRNTATRTYNSMTMRTISSCDFCGMNCTLCKSNVPIKNQTTRASSPRVFMIWFCVILIYYLL
ncbi:CD109 antigen-like isoform X2 [Ascaphus truei]|uniref:CD109 antigen-like isoform X2 n=1 Tax=Ascaphus truei TaxID=8439 RepID=UPI003F5A7752